MTKEEEELKQLEEQLRQLENTDNSDISSYGSPSPEKKENIFKFFKEILSFPETWKVGNLKDTEIGDFRYSIRKSLRMSRYAKAEGLNRVSDYLNSEAVDVAAVSMGRKGFLPQLFVTQIKREQKLQEPKNIKKGLFGTKKEETENE